tara:strand:+ start:4477 stop:5346 length:870 start_codon:yes stop_codon:yes gene_type:complete
LTKIISILVYKVLIIINKLIKFVFGRSFLIELIDLIEERSYREIKISNKKITFFTPNKLTETRVNDIFHSEIETINWIKKFNKSKKIIFWDIGANIGIYSIYAAIKHKNIEITSFEPSTNNLRVLSRNISINKLQKKIQINQLPLSNKKNQYLLMRESSFIQGGALNSYHEKTNFEGKKLQEINKYKILGTTINSILNNKISKCPNYVKIDVDGIEHLILSKANNLLKNKDLKSILIEINENYKRQLNSVLKIMKKNKFKLLSKEQSNLNNTPLKFKNTYNYIFVRNKH